MASCEDHCLEMAPCEDHCLDVLQVVDDGLRVFHDHHCGLEKSHSSGDVRALWTSHVAYDGLVPHCHGALETLHVDDGDGLHAT